MPWSQLKFWGKIAIASNKWQVNGKRRPQFLIIEQTKISVMDLSGKFTWLFTGLS
jgi:hypothetical protein